MIESNTPGEVRLGNQLGPLPPNAGIVSYAGYEEGHVLASEPEDPDVAYDVVYSQKRLYEFAERAVAAEHECKINASLKLELAHSALQYWAAEDIDAPACVQEALEYLNEALAFLRPNS